MKRPLRIVVCCLAAQLARSRPATAQPGLGILHTFPPAQVPTQPYAITQTPDGGFLVMTSEGSPTFVPVLLRVDANGGVSVLHVFDGFDTSTGPTRRLMIGLDGNYYGTTRAGGDFDKGAVFRVTPGGQFSAVYSFTGSEDGQSPGSRLVRAPDGDLFGTAFTFTASGPITSFFVIGADGVVHTPQFQINNASEVFAIGPDFTLYGIGFSSSGTPQLYTVSSDGAITKLHDFDVANAFLQDFDLGVGADGVPFGIAPGRSDPTLGYNDLSGVFRFGAGGYQSLASLTASCCGVGAFERPDGTLYGHLNGSVFRIGPSGDFALLHQLSVDDGLVVTDMIPSSDGTLWGTTQSGGVFRGGSIFRMTLDGALTTVAALLAGNSEGADPSGALVSPGNGDLYGTTFRGGLFNQGTIFRMTRTGSFATLYTFLGRGDGGGPQGLVLGPEGAMYGTTGSTDPERSLNATFFRIAPSGALLTLHVFRNATEGYRPGPLILARDGFFYGRTEITAFRMSTSGDLSVLHTFEPADGLAGSATTPFLQASDGNLYGATIKTTCCGDPPDFYGSVFRMTLDGRVTTLHTFANGAADAGSPDALLQGLDGNIYGTISGGGAGARIFTIAPPSGAFVLSPALSGPLTGAGGISLRVRAGDRSFYGVANFGSGIAGEQTNDAVFRLAPQGDGTLVHTFTGLSLNAESLLDGGYGELYGTSHADSTINAGTIFHLPLVPPAVPPRQTPTARNDYDGDGKADMTVYRSSTGTWYVLQSSTAWSTAAAFQFGASTDLPVPGDYDGDGKTDFAVFRPSTGVWYVWQSSTQTMTALQFGNGADLPVPGDYDGDRKTDIAVFRPSTGVWYVWQSSTLSMTALQFGNGADIPVPADYDGDGKTDIAVFRPSTGVWYVWQSSTLTTTANQWANPGDIPVPGDYDGDGKADLTVFRPSNGVWYVLQSSTLTMAATQWASANDIPVPADYDGDGITDLAVFRPSNGTWHIRQSSTLAMATFQWGNSADISLPRHP